MILVYVIVLYYMYEVPGAFFFVPNCVGLESVGTFLCHKFLGLFWPFSVGFEERGVPDL